MYGADTYATLLAFGLLEAVPVLYKSEFSATVLSLVAQPDHCVKLTCNGKTAVGYRFSLARGIGGASCMLHG